MALAKWSAAELKALGETLTQAGAKILTTVEKMDLAKYPDLILQASNAVSIYAPALANLAGTIESEFQDQYEAFKFNRPPRWEMNRRKVEERDRRNARKKKAFKKRSAPATSPEIRQKRAKGKEHPQTP